MTSLCDVMRISCTRKERELYKESMTKPRAVITVVWVFRYKVFGFINKPQTLYFGCIVAPQGGSITRMGIAIYLFIYRHPDFAGGLLVTMILVV